jgi:PLP dependent protein
MSNNLFLACKFIGKVYQRVITLRTMSVVDNLQTTKSRLPASCKLIAVTKTHPVELIREAYDAGHRAFGENKVQEMLPKYDALPKDIQWHLIGHLQTNKVKYITSFVSLIHSVDSVKLLEEINKQAQKHGRTVPCLLQVHIAEEESKFGFSRSEIETLLERRLPDNLDHVQIDGLMGMATLTENAGQIRKEFRGLRALFESLKTRNLPPNMKMNELSMGMSSDFQLAIEEGSTMVRIGSAIFGQRRQK